MTAMRIAENQTVSFAVYMQAIYNSVNCPAEFIRQHVDRIGRAYDMGEPIKLICNEMQLRYDHRPQRTKTPRQLAKRVVKVGPAAAIDAICDDLAEIEAERAEERADRAREEKAHHARIAEQFR